MPKILATIFLVGILVGVFFPLTSLAADPPTYKINFCEFTDANGNKDFDSGEPLENIALCEEREATYSGFVPCGKCVKGNFVNGQNSLLTPKIKATTQQRCGKVEDQVYINCQLCHFFVMLNEAINFILITIVPPLAILMLVIGGAMFYLGGAKPDMIQRGRKLIISVAIGLALIYGAYMIVGFLLTIVGAANIGAIGSVFQNGVFSIDCPIILPTP